MRRVALLLVLFLAAPLSACWSTASTGARAAVVRSDGSVSGGVISALDAQPTDAGPQEIIGINVPLGPHFRLKGGVVWDGTTWTVGPPTAPQAAPMSAAPQFVDVDEQVQVPVTKWETQTRRVRKAVVPIPQAAPDPCAPAPAPQAAPKAAGCEPVAVKRAGFARSACHGGICQVPRCP